MVDDDEVDDEVVDEDDELLATARAELVLRALLHHALDDALDEDARGDGEARERERVVELAEERERPAEEPMVRVQRALRAVHDLDRVQRKEGDDHRAAHEIRPEVLALRVRDLGGVELLARLHLADPLASLAVDEDAREAEGERLGLLPVHRLEPVAGGLGAVLQDEVALVAEPRVEVDAALEGAEAVVGDDHQQGVIVTLDALHHLADESVRLPVELGDDVLELLRVLFLSHINVQSVPTS